MSDINIILRHFSDQVQLTVKRFLESNASSIRGTFFSLGYVKVPRIEEAFDSKHLLPSTTLEPTFLSSHIIKQRKEKGVKN